MMLWKYSINFNYGSAAGCRYYLTFRKSLVGEEKLQAEEAQNESQEPCGCVGEDEW